MLRAFKQPHRKVGSIEQGRYNAPTSDLVMFFTANDEVGKDRCAFYNLHDNKGKQSVCDLNPQYDLLQYPLFFADGGRVKLGWGEKIKKVMDVWTNIWSVYSRLMWHNDKSYKEKISIDEMIVEINKIIPKPVKKEHFEYVQYTGLKKPYVSMKQFYNFLLQERSGEIKPEFFTPVQELNLYKMRCNKGRKKKDRVPVDDPKKTWVEKVKHEGKEYTICPHPMSHAICCMEMVNGKEKYIPLPFKFRKEEKKNPILYGERLKLFYLCDQGVKIDNNNLRFHEKPEQQKKYNQVSFKAGNDMADKGEKVENQGRRYILPSSYSHSKRAYSQRYYDAVIFSKEFLVIHILMLRWQFVWLNHDQIYSLQ